MLTRFIAVVYLAASVTSSVNFDNLNTAAAAVVAANGASGFITPSSNLKGWGMTSTTASEQAALRIAGTWQLAAAAVLLAPVESLSSSAPYAAAAAILLSIPSIETIGETQKPKANCER